MKKIDQPKNAVLPSATLYIEDIEEILEVLKKFSRSTTISTGDFEFDSLEELKKEHGQTLKSLKLQSYDPYISLEFKRSNLMSTWLYTGSQSQAALAAFYQIKEILLRRRKFMNYIFHPILGIVCALVLVILTYLIPSDTYKLLFPSRTDRGLLALVLLTTVSLSFLYRMGFFYTINLKRAHESPSFFSRQKDDIIKMLVAALIGAVLHWLFTKL